MAKPARDYYEVLGVAKDAAADVLKTAYRRLARKFHPDTAAKDEKDAESKFKEMKEAYEVLKDPQKRAAYDQWGDPAMNAGANGPGGFSPTGSPDLDEAIRRAVQQQQRQNAERFKVQQISIPVDIMIRGGKANFRYVVQSGGDGVFTFNHSIGQVTLKPDTPVGHRIRTPNMPGAEFVIMPQGSTRCQIQNNDLIVPFEVNALAVAIGSKVAVNHPNGKKYDVSIPDGTKNGTAIRLPDLGLPHVSGMTGSLIAIVNYTVPTLTTEQKEALKNILEPANLP